MKRDIKHIVFCMLVALTGSCSREDIPSTVDDGTVPVTFKLKFPADMRMQHPDTKSISGEGEKTISSLDLLAFVSNGREFIYSYHISVNYVQGSHSFTVNLKKVSGSRQVFVVVANASQALADARITQQDNLEAALSRLVVVSLGEWPAAINGSSDIRDLPMYFQTPPLIISELTSQVGPYDFIRMLARIDVTVSSPATSHFVLTQVMIYNRKTCGYVAYNDSYDPVTKMVTTANVPAFFPGTTDDPTIKEPGVIYQVPTTGPDAGSLIRSLYTFEAKGGSNKYALTSIIIGGNYGTPPSPSGEITYYRVDIKASSATSSDVGGDILRNHLYAISIQNISGPGAFTPDAAFSGPSQITAEVVDWSLAQDNVILDQQYTLKLSTDQMFLDYKGLGPTGSPITFTTTTDHPSGISAIEDVIDVSTGTTPTWLILNRTTPVGNTSCQIQVSAQLNSNSSERIAHFTIRAGNMRYVVAVTQAAYGFVANDFPVGSAKE